jgi:hypothetical protein
MIGALIGSMVGWKLGQKYLTPTTETPMWTGHIAGDVGQPSISVTSVRSKGKQSYRVYVVDGATWALAAACWQWPEVLSVLAQWETFMAHGGTVTGWLARNAQREEEIRKMEEAFHA